MLSMMAASRLIQIAASRVATKRHVMALVQVLAWVSDMSCSSARFLLPSSFKPILMEHSFVVAPHAAQIAVMHADDVIFGPTVWDEMSLDDPEKPVGFLEL